jgi:thiol-disulfide isomerase/thioredoxin
VLVALAAATACTGKNAVNQGVSGSLGYDEGDHATTWTVPSHRSSVDGVSGSLLDGSAFDLSQWRGHVVVVDFWGSWCAPCTSKAEVQALTTVYQDNRKNGVEFLGVDVRDNRASAQSFVRAHHVTYPSLFDASNLMALRFHGLPPNATPTTVVLDRQGRIAARHSGAIFYTQLRDLVARAVAEPS